MVRLFHLTFMLVLTCGVRAQDSYRIDFLNLFTPEIIVDSSQGNQDALKPMTETHKNGELLNHEEPVQLEDYNGIGLGANIFLGTGILSGNMEKYFSDTYFLGFNIDLLKKRILVRFDDYIGFGMTKQTMTLRRGVWEENKPAFSNLFGGNLGYSLVDLKRFKLVPITGLGFNWMTPSPCFIIHLMNFLTPDTEFVECKRSKIHAVLPFFKAGCYVDFKIRRGDFFDTYRSLRLSFGYTKQIGKPKYSEYFLGSMFYFTFGIGLFSW